MGYRHDHHACRAHTYAHGPSTARCDAHRGRDRVGVRLRRARVRECRHPAAVGDHPAVVGVDARLVRHRDPACRGRPRLPDSHACRRRRPLAHRRHHDRPPLAEGLRGRHPRDRRLPVGRRGARARGGTRDNGIDARRDRCHAHEARWSEGCEEDRRIRSAGRHPCALHRPDYLGQHEAGHRPVSRRVRSTWVGGGRRDHQRRRRDIGADGRRHDDTGHAGSPPPCHPGCHVARDRRERAHRPEPHRRGHLLHRDLGGGVHR